MTWDIDRQIHTRIEYAGNRECSVTDFIQLKERLITYARAVAHWNVFWVGFHMNYTVI